MFYVNFQIFKITVINVLTLAGAVRSSEEVPWVRDQEEEAASLVSAVEAASCSLSEIVTRSR